MLLGKLHFVILTSLIISLSFVVTPSFAVDDSSHYKKTKYSLGKFFDLFKSQSKNPKDLKNVHDRFIDEVMNK